MQSGNLFKQALLHSLLVRYQMYKLISLFGNRGISHDNLYSLILRRTKPTPTSRDRFDKLIKRMEQSNLITEVNGTLTRKES